MTRLPRAYLCIDRSGLGGAGGRTPSLSILSLASLATVVLGPGPKFCDFSVSPLILR